MCDVTTQAGYIDRQVDFGPSSRHYSAGSYWQQQQVQAPNFPIPQSTQAAGYHGTNFLYNTQEQVDQAQFSSSAFQNHASVLPTSQFGESAAAGAGRPPHTVVAFGFGGTLSVIRPVQQSIYRASPTVISVYSLHTVVPAAAGLEASPTESKSKSEVLKWIDERRAKCPCEEQVTRSQALPLLWGALKIALEHHGKIRSPAGCSMEGNGPEAALGQMMLSASPAASNHCLHRVPTDEAQQAVVMKVNGLMLSGRTQQALHCAEEGRLWGTALVLAARLGEAFYSNTVAKMAYDHPSLLRTLALLTSGQYAQLFETPAEPTQGSILDYWHETLTLLATNRAAGVENLLVHLGDTLWSERGEVGAAHLSYLLVDQNSESFFNDGRICLIGADHWQQPRTFVTPLAIKRTEIYEHLKTIANPQFVLMNFLPYKIVFAHLLAEAGMLSEASRYCQAISKTLKSKEFSHCEASRQVVTDLEQRLSGSLNGKGTLTGRILSSTFNFVKGSLPPAPRLTRFKSSVSIQETENYVRTPTRSVSEPDFSKSDASAPVPTGLLRRLGSSVYKKAAGMVSSSSSSNSSSKQTNLEEQNADDMVVRTGYEMPPPSPRKASGLYVQCSDYYSRCMDTLNTGRSSLASIPFKFISSTPAAPRLEV